MRSLALFAPTFARVQTMLQSVQRIKATTFKHTCKRRDLCIYRHMQKYPRVPSSLPIPLKDASLRYSLPSLSNSSPVLSSSCKIAISASAMTMIARGSRWSHALSLPIPIPGCTFAARRLKNLTIQLSGRPSTSISSRILKNISLFLTRKTRPVVIFSCRIRS